MIYKIFDNFFDEQDFKILEKIKLPEIHPASLKVYHNKILKDGSVKKNDCIDTETLKYLHNKYHNKTLKILENLYPEKVNLYQYSEFHVIQTGSDYKFPPHDDTPDKLLSGVVYINPEINKGTIFFKDKKGNGKETVDWKKNRAVFFSRRERETWHSYEGDGKSNRVALVYNLMTKDIKEVCKIENKSYLISLIRYKLNPYIYRYFKTLI